MAGAAEHGASPSPLVTWGRLLRVPNLFTVPGDPIAGYLLASGGVLGWDVLGAVAASLCLYSAGLLLNDYFDREVDARERPERPIPSGAVKARTVLIAGGMLLVAGPGIACAACGGWAGTLAAVTALLVYAYDAGLKHVRSIGPATMGACRAGSVLIGAGAAGSLLAAPALIVAGITGAYVTSVTVLAARETEGGRPGWPAFVPPGILLGGVGVMLTACFPEFPPHLFMLLLPFSLGFHGVGAAVRRVRRGRIPVPPFIGALLRATIGFQTGWALWQSSILRESAWAILLAGVVLFACAELTSRRFYGS